MSSNNSKKNSRIQSGKSSLKRININKKVFDPYNDDIDSLARNSPISLNNKGSQRKIKINISDQDDIENRNDVSIKEEKIESPVNKSIADKNLNDSKTNLKSELNISDKNEESKSLNENSIQREVSGIIKDNEKNYSESKKSNFLRETLKIRKSLDQGDDEIKIKYKSVDFKENQDKHVNYEESNRLKLLDNNANKGEFFSKEIIFIFIYGHF